MVLTQIVKKRNSVNLTFDNEVQISVPYELFIQLALYKGDKTTKAQINELRNKIEIFKIKQSAFRYLSGRNHSKNELRLKLIKKGFEKKPVSQVLDELEKLQYLDDKEYTYQFYKSGLKKKKGILKIKSELLKKGVDRYIVEEVGESFLEDPILIESAVSLAERKLNSLNNKNYSVSQLKQKVFAYLSQRGFSSEIIMESFARLGIN